MKERLREGMDRVAAAMKRPLHKPPPRKLAEQSAEEGTQSKKWKRMFELDLGGTVTLNWAERADEVSRKGRMGVKRAFLKDQALLDIRMRHYG